MTLTASVTSGGNPVNTGIVNFYQLIGSSKLLLSSQPLTVSAHTAVLKYTFGVGTSTVEAAFQATGTQYASSSITRTVTVTGTNTTTTSISSSGSAGNYTLTGTVKAYGMQPPTGDISFEDASNANTVLATQVLDTTTQAPTFAENKSCSTQNCAVGSNPYSVQTADLNGDGILDIVVANNGGTVNVYLGAGDGTFTIPAPSSYTFGTALNYVGIADVNRDGIPDLLVAMYGSSQVGILLGDGSGHFGSITAYNSGLQPSSVIAADFNSDGIFDLAVSNYQGSSVSIRLGNSDGTFQSPTSITVGDGPNQVVAADLNGDGNMDVVVPDIATGGVRVLFGDGDGTLQAPVFYSTNGNIVSSALIADFNEDGFPDIAAVADRVYIYLNNGSGSFSSATTYAVGSTPSGLTMGDFNMDGHLDLAVVNLNSSNMSVLLGKGNGTFAARTNYPTQADPAAITSGDFNGDGLPDLALTTAVGPLEVYQASQSASATVSGISIIGTSSSHNVFASYAGDTHSSSSTSSTIALTGSTTLSASMQSTAAYGDTVTITGSFAPGSAGLSGSDFQLLVDSAVVPANISYLTGTVSATYSGWTVGSHTVALKFNGTSQYLTATSNALSLTVTRAIPVISWATPAAITYGTPLSAAQLNASASVGGTVVDGTMTYSHAAGEVLGAGTYTLSVTFVPTDSTNYTQASQTVSLTVNKATPQVVWGAPATIVYGTALSAAQLDAVASVSGKLTYSPDFGTVLSSGTQALSVTFVADDTNNYNSPVTQTVSLTVTKATPSLTWSSPAAIVYGLALSGTQLNASSSVAGSFSYSPAAGTVLAAGSYTLTAGFTPTDTTDYAVQAATVGLTVNKASTTTTLAASASSAIAGQSVVLTSTVLPVTGSAPSGTVSFYDGSVLLGTSPLSNGQAGFTASNLSAGTQSFSAIYSGDSNFLGSGTASAVAVVVSSQDFTVQTASSGTQTVLPGGQAVYTFSVAPLSGIFTSPVSFTLSGLPQGATYNFSPSSFAAGTTGGTVAVTIQTTKTATASLRSQSRGLVLALVFLPMLPFRKRVRKGSTLLILILALFGSLSFLSGCGAKGIFAQAPKNYVVTLTTASGTQTHTTTFTLNVQ